MAPAEQFAAITKSIRGEFFKKMQKEYLAMEQKLKTECEQQVQKLKDDAKKKDDEYKKEKVCVTSKRSFSDVPNFSGKPDEYDDWTFKVRTFFTDEIDFVRLLLELDALTDMPGEAALIEIYNTLLVDNSGLTEEQFKKMKNSIYRNLSMKITEKNIYSG